MITPLEDNLGQERATWMEILEHVFRITFTISMVTSGGGHGSCHVWNQLPGWCSVKDAQSCVLSIISACLEGQGNSTPTLALRQSRQLGSHPGVIYRAHSGRCQG